MNTMIVRTSLAIGLLLGITWIVGCAQQPAADRPTTYSVTGTVTFQGNPVEGATVAFSPTQGKQGAFATTDASGKYSLTTFVGGDGALPGEYKVKISQYEKEAPSGGEGEEYVPPEETGEGEDSGPKNLLPEKYADANSSGLTATVTEGENTIDFALE